MALRVLGSMAGKWGELHEKDSRLKEEEGNAGSMPTKAASFNMLVATCLSFSEISFLS